MAASDTQLLSAFGSAFREARLRVGMTQASLSDLAKISSRTIIRWEAGQVSPWMPELQSAIRVLAISDAETASLLKCLDTSRRHLTVDPDTAGRHARILNMARIRANLKSTDVAAAMGCDPSTVARWEAGRLSPKADELERLWTIVAVRPNEIAEMDSHDRAFDLNRDEDLEERILGILWPWDREGYHLFDIRFSNLFEQIEHAPNEERRSIYRSRAKTAYAWILAACGRYRQAQEYSDEVLAMFRSREIPPAPYSIVAALVLARCSYRSLSERGIKRGIGMLDMLDKRPLDWELLACRYDAYAEAYACQRSFDLALEYSDRAIDAATKCGRRLGRLMRFNRCRVLLMSGSPELALQGLPEFSELTPLNDANEALTMALIYDSLGNTRQAGHWRTVAGGVIEEFQLHAAVDDHQTGGWSVPSLFAAM